MISAKTDTTLADPIGELERNSCNTSIEKCAVCQETEAAKPGELDQSNSEKVSLNDTEDPQKWSRQKKWTCTIVTVLMTATIAFCPSIYTAAISDLSVDFRLSRTVATLGVTTFLLGF